MEANRVRLPLRVKRVAGGICDITWTAEENATAMITPVSNLVCEREPLPRRNRRLIDGQDVTFESSDDPPVRAVNMAVFDYRAEVPRNRFKINILSIYDSKPH